MQCENSVWSFYRDSLHAFMVSLHSRDENTDAQIHFDAKDGSFQVYVMLDWHAWKGASRHSLIERLCKQLKTFHTNASDQYWMFLAKAGGDAILKGLQCFNQAWIRWLFKSFFYVFLKKPQTSEQYCVKEAVHPHILLFAANYLQYYLLHVNPNPVCFLVSKISISDKSSSMSVKVSKDP